MILKRVKEYFDGLQHKSIAYNQVFQKKSIHAQVVLKDLAEFCRAHKTTFLPDPRAHAVLEGRREVWLKIQEYLQLTPEQIYQLHKVKEIVPGETPNG